MWGYVGEMVETHTWYGGRRGGGVPHNSSVEGGMTRDIFVHLASCKTSRST